MKMIVHRGLSLLLCMVLLFGCLSPGFAVAFAAELDEIESTEATEATSATEAAETIPETEPSGPGQEEENAENPTEPVLETEDEVPDGTEVPDTTEETNVTEDPGETEPQPTEEPDMPLLASSRAMVGTCEIKSYGSLRLAARYTVTVSYSLSDGGSRKSSITAINWHYIDEPENPGYCLEPNKTAPYGSDRPLETTNSTAEMTSGTVGAAAWNKLTAQQRRAIALVALYGLPNNFWDEDSGLKNYGEYVDGNLNRAYFAAGQIIVWEFVMGLRETTWPFDYTNRSDATALFDAFDGRKSFNIGYEAITKDLYEHYLLPSFAAGAKANAPTITLQPDGNGYYTATVTDTNDILDKFTFEDSSGNVTFTRSGNKLTIKAKSLPSDPVFAGSKYVPSANNTSYFLAYGEDDYQTMIAIANQGADDPVYAYLKLEIPGGKIEVKKTDPNGKALAGAEFGVYNSAGTMVATIGPTDANGYAISGNLPYGTYTIKETKYPTGYTSGDTTSWTATINSSQSTYTINAKNIEISGSLKIQKATNTGKNLSGWSFGVYTDKACTKAISGSPFATSSDGTVTVTGLAPGTYYVKELHSNDNYWVVDSDVKTVKVESSKTASVTVTNTHYGYAKIVKATNTGKNLGGWKFNIYTDQACTKVVSGSPFITADDGTISVKLLPGTYYVREVDESAQHPEWIYDTSTRSVTVVAGDTKSVTFTNSQKSYVKIIKTTNTGKNLSGWQFNIYTDADCTKLVSGSPFTSGADGTIVAQLEPGTYFIEECNKSSDYPDWDLDDGCHIVTVKAGETASVTFENIHYGYAQIVKKTNTGSNLSGWKFNIYTDEACTKLVSGSPFTTDASGLITTKLLPGDYYVREVDESATYPEWTFDTAVKKVSVTAGDTKSVTFTNIQSGWIKLIKAMPDGGSVSGWVFEVYQASDNKLIGTYTSGEDGAILTDALIPGEYLVKEIIPEDSLYVCESENPQTVTIVGGQTAEVTFTNRIKPGEIEILKVNEKGNPLAGAQFRLEWSTDGTNWNIVTPSDSQYVTEGTCTSQGLVNGTLVTNTEGLATFTGLHPERLYRLTEVAAPDGYQLLTMPAYEGGLDIENELRIVIKVTNFPVYELPKTGSNSLLLMPLVGLMALTACAAIVFTTTFRRKKA